MNVKICTETFGSQNPSNIETYIKLGGYQAWKNILKNRTSKVFPKGFKIYKSPDTINADLIRDDFFCISSILFSDKNPRTGRCIQIKYLCHLLHNRGTKQWLAEVYFLIMEL